MALRDAVDATVDHGYPVWVGGRYPVVRALAAARADGWNRWGPGVERFRAQAADLRLVAARSPFAISWGGLVVLGADERDAAAKAERLSPAPGVIVGGPERVADALREYADAGADLLVVGPDRLVEPREREHPRRAGATPPAGARAWEQPARERQLASLTEGRRRRVRPWKCTKSPSASAVIMPSALSVPCTFTTLPATRGASTRNSTGTPTGVGLR